MRAAFCILFLVALNLCAQVTKDVRAFNVSGIIQEPIMFFRTNIYAGANISITHSANGTITIAGGAGGGTNAIVLTNGVLVGQIGTLNFVSGVTGYVSGAEVRLGVDVVSGSGASITVSSNYVITTPAITNLNFVMGTNIFIVVTNTSGDASVWINVDKFGITNGLATISYVNQSTQFVTTAHGTLTVSNGAYLGVQDASDGIFYGWDGANTQYRRVMAVGDSEVTFATNDISVGFLAGDTYFRAGRVSPLTDLSTWLGNSSGSFFYRWGYGFFGPTGLFSGRLSLTNRPGEGLPYLEIRSTNGQAYTRFSRLDDNWKPTNYFKFSVTNPVAGQILKFNSVTYSGGEATIILTNDTDNSGGGGGLTTNDTQFGASVILTVKDGAEFTNLIVRSSATHSRALMVNTNVFIVTNNRVGIRLTEPTAHLTVGGTGPDPAVFHVGDSGSTNMMTKGQIGKLDDNPLNILINGLSKWIFANGLSEFAFAPSLSNTHDIGTIVLTVRTNFTVHSLIKERLTLGTGTNINSYTAIQKTNYTGLFTGNDTNVLWLSLFNPSVGQIFKFNTVTWDANGVAHVVITNAADNSGGGGGGAFNMNQFSASTLTNLKQYLLITNPIVYSTNVQSTNLVIQLLSAASGAALSILTSAGAMITEVNSNGFFMQTNTLTNYVRGGTLPTPTNTIALGVENYAGRIMPTWFDDKALQFSYQPFLGNNRVFMILTSASTAAGVFGVTTAVPAGGTTISHPAPTFTQPYMVSIATGTTSNNCAAIMSSVDLASSGNHNGSGDPRGFGIKAGYFFAIEWSDTNNISGIVGGGATRTFTGLTALANTTATNLVVTTNATGQYIGLYSDPKQSLNMYISARDASAEFRTNTGINFVATNIYQFYLMNTHTSRFAHWKLKDLTARTEAYGWFSNNVPTNFMKMIIATKNGTNRAHSVKFSKMYLETPLTPQ